MTIIFFIDYLLHVITCLFVDHVGLIIINSPISVYSNKFPVNRQVIFFLFERHLCKYSIMCTIFLNPLVCLLKLEN